MTMRYATAAAVLGICGIVAMAGASALVQQQPATNGATPTERTNLGSLGVLGTMGEPAWVHAFDGVQIFTKPSQDAILGFSTPTKVEEIRVRGGARVTQGQMLARGDDGEQASLLELATIRASEDLRVQRAIKQAELALKEFRRAEEAHEDASVTQLELDRARLGSETTALDVSIEQNQFQQDAVQVDRMQSMLDRFHLKAPFDGIVDEVFVDVGQSIGDTEPVIRVVNIDTLHLDVPMPADEVIALSTKPGDRAWVLVDAGGTPELTEGEVVEVAPTADFASRSIRVRVEIANPVLRPSGLPAWVRLREPTDAWREATRGVGARVIEEARRD